MSEGGEPDRAEPEAPERATADARVGELLSGRYRIVAPLDAGGTARVYLAIQEPLGREVAIKLLRPDIDAEQQENFEPRFFREAAVLGALSHSNVVTVHDYGRTEDGACFVVMERLRGRTLRQALADGPMAPEEAARIAIGVARGLRYAHQQGLVHRDVKPSNVFLVLDESGVEQPKLLDFGLVKDLRASESTSVGTFLGTPHYVAPEQATGKSVDARADLYALGVLLYRMLAGTLPYEADNAMAVALAHIREAYPPIARRAPGVVVDPALEAIVRRMMAKEPGDRPADAGEVSRQLEAWLATRVVGAPPVSMARRRLWWMVPGALVLAVVGVSLGLWIGRPGLFINNPGNTEVSNPEGDVAWAPGVPAVEIEPVAAEPVPAEPVPAQPVPAEPVASEPVPAEPAQAAPATTPKPTLAPASPKATTKAGSARDPSEKSSPPPGPKTSGGAASGAAGTYDGVTMTAAEAGRALHFLNTATEAELRAAGIYGRGVGIILEGRPFPSMQAAADTPFIGEKTLISARDAR